MAQLSSSTRAVVGKAVPLCATACNSTRSVLLHGVAATSAQNDCSRPHQHRGSAVAVAASSTGDASSSPQQPWAPLVSFASYLASAAPMSLPPRLLVSLLQACASAQVQPDPDHLAALCRNFLRQVQPPTSPLEAAEFGIDLLTTLAAMRPLQQQPGLQTPTGMAAGEHREFMSSMLDNIICPSLHLLNPSHLAALMAALLTLQHPLTPAQALSCSKSMVAADSTGDSNMQARLRPGYTPVTCAQVLTLLAAHHQQWRQQQQHKQSQGRPAGSDPQLDADSNGSVQEGAVTSLQEDAQAVAADSTWLPACLDSLREGLQSGSITGCEALPALEYLAKQAAITAAAAVITSQTSQHQLLAVVEELALVLGEACQASAEQAARLQPVSAAVALESAVRAAQHLRTAEGFLSSSPLSDHGPHVSLGTNGATGNASEPADANIAPGVSAQDNSSNRSYRDAEKVLQSRLLDLATTVTQVTSPALLSMSPDQLISLAQALHAAGWAPPRQGMDISKLWRTASVGNTASSNSQASLQAVAASALQGEGAGASAPGPMLVVLPSVGAGTNAYGVSAGQGSPSQPEALANGMPITVIATNADRSSGNSAAASVPDMAETITFTSPSGTSTSMHGSAGSVDSDSRSTSMGQDWVSSVHQALVQNLGHFSDSDHLMDLLRPLAAMGASAMPSREVLSTLAAEISDMSDNQTSQRNHPSSGDTQPATMTTGPADASSSQAPHSLQVAHRIVMSLFLFATLGFKPPRSTLEAAQHSLTPVMSHLPPGDLTNAVWGMAVLRHPKQQPPVTSSDTDTGTFATTSSKNSSGSSGGSGGTLDSQQPEAPPMHTGTAPGTQAPTPVQQGVQDNTPSPLSSVPAVEEVPPAWPRGNQRPTTVTLADIAAANTANAATQAASTGHSDSQGAGSSHVQVNGSEASVRATGAASRSASPGVSSRGWSQQAARSPGTSRAALSSAAAAHSNVETSDSASQEDAWFSAALAAVEASVDRQALQPYQLAFALGSLERFGAPVPGSLIDKILGSVQAQLPSCSTADVTLVLASVARMQHVASYSWSEAVCEGYLLAHADQLSPKEIATVVWAMARIRHTPSPPLVTRLLDAAEPQLTSFTADNIATLVWGLAEVAPDAPVTLFMEAVVSETQERLLEFNPHDLVSLLSALAKFQHRPPEAWLSDALRALNANLPFLDGRGCSEILASLVTLGARLSDHSWLERFCRIVQPMLSSMDPVSLESLGSSLLTLRHMPGTTFTQHYMDAVERVFSSAGAARSTQQQQLAAGRQDAAAQPAITAETAEGLLAVVLGLGRGPGPQQAAGTERVFAGLTALRSLGPARLVRFIGSLGEVAERYGPSSLPRTAWLGGPLVEVLQESLPSMHLTQQSELTRALGRLVDALCDEDQSDQEVATDVPGNAAASQEHQQQEGNSKGAPGWVPSRAAPPQTSSRGPSACPPQLRNLLSQLREFYLWS